MKNPRLFLRNVQSATLLILCALFFIFALKNVNASNEQALASPTEKTLVSNSNTEIVLPPQQIPKQVSGPYQFKNLSDSQTKNYYLLGTGLGLLGILFMGGVWDSMFALIKRFVGYSLGASVSEQQKS